MYISPFAHFFARGDYRPEILAAAKRLFQILAIDKTTRGWYRLKIVTKGAVFEELYEPRL